MPGAPPIETSVREDEAAKLAELADRGGVLEIGSLLGFSTIVMAASARRVTAIDPHTGWGGTEARFRANLAAYGVTDKVDIRVDIASRVVPTLTAKSFDMAFVDGDHSYNAVLQDCAMCERVVRPGGVIAMHDYCSEDCPEVAPAIDRFRSGRPIEVIATLAVLRL